MSDSPRVEPCQICGSAVRVVRVQQEGGWDKRVCTNPKCRSKQIDGLTAAEAV